MAINIKFTKFDNTPWGFRLAGGSDFPQPLTVIRVTEGSLAECMGLKVGDVVVRLNDQSISSLTHGQAHEELMRAGNNFVLGVLREEDPLKALEALSEENIVPYKIPLADLPPLFPEQILKEETVIEQYEEVKCETQQAEEEVKPEVEPLPDKPKDADSEIVPNQNLTDDEIAQLILEEEELLTDKGVLGVNFKKLKPRATVLRQSKVIEELRNIAESEPPLVEQLRRTSVFLQKPQRPIPAPRKKPDEQEDEGETYKVVIKKQKKRSVTDRLLERGLLRPGDASTPEPPTPEVNMENNEMGRKIEEDGSSIVSLTPLDDSLCLQQPLEPTTATCSVVSSPCLEPSIEICQSQSPPDVEFEVHTNSESDVAPVQLSKRREYGVLARRASNKRKFKGLYTRGHYFRRCLLGKRSCGDVKRAVKVKPSFRERFQESDRTVEEFQQVSRRSSVEKSSKSRIKGRYLETYLKREDNWMRRMIDGLFEKPVTFSSSKLFDRLLSNKQISLRRTRYAEKILVRSVEFIAARLRSDIVKRIGRGCSMRIANTVESKSRIDKRLYFKGRYFQRMFWRNVGRLLNCIKGIVSSKDVSSRNRRRSSAMLKMKGRYLETYLLENTLPGLHNFGDRFSIVRSNVVSPKTKFFVRTRYVERILKKHFESLGLIIGYIRCQVLQSIPDSSIVSSSCISLKARQNDACCVLPVKKDDVFSNLIRCFKDLISTEIFHRGSRRLSRSSRGSVSVNSWSLSSIWRSSLFNWLPLKFARESTDRTINDKKIIQDNDRDGRRLSFVPTILYEDLTNRIGVDFTRLVAYAFVPCTSIILLYIYK